MLALLVSIVTLARWAAQYISLTDPACPMMQITDYVAHLQSFRFTTAGLKHLQRTVNSIKDFNMLMS